MTSFSDFGLIEPIQKALAAEGYVTPTPIQVQAIPPALEGHDILGIAQTGTGKTAAFALPILNRLSAAPKPRKPRSCRVLVLSPTRELASQIADSFRAYAANLRVSTQVVFGGVPVGRHERGLASGVDVLVATPGRLLDLIDRRALTLNDVEILVLDEADQMLDLGFIHDLKRLVRLLPTQRQSLFFSATMPKTIAGLADAYLKEPVKVSVTPVATTAERVDQQVIFVPGSRKQPLLAALLQDPAIDRVLVFTRTKHGADRVVRQLGMVGIEAAAIHGNKSQNHRERTLDAFRSGHCRVLVATDIAARGIDVEGVSHVINFELPNVPEAYVHRIGRTARAGAAGIAISFCNDEERAYLRDIERLTRLKVPVANAPEGFDLRDTGARDTDERGPRPQQNRGQRQGQGRPSQGRPGQGHGRPSQGKPSQGRGGEGRSGGGRSGDARHGESRQGEGRHSESRPAYNPASGGPARSEQRDGAPGAKRRRGRGGSNRSEGGREGGSERGNSIAWLGR